MAILKWSFGEAHILFGDSEVWTFMCQILLDKFSGVGVVMEGDPIRWNQTKLFFFLKNAKHCVTFAITLNAHPYSEKWRWENHAVGTSSAGTDEE